nr:hypothetical protein [Bacilli bacterium]
YSELESQKIAWKDIFRQKQNRYFCYIYSERCGHCKDIKNEVIEYGLGHSAFYIIEYDKSIPLMNDISTTIGMTNVEYVGILGTPTLLSIISQTLIENIAGSNKVIEKLRNS